MLTLTESAQAAVAKFMTVGAKDYRGLRIGVNGMGCSGPSYAMLLEEAASEDDILVACGAVTVIVDSFSAPMLDGTVVDFVEEDDRSGFTFANPNTPSCHCGPGAAASCGGTH